MVLFQDNPKLVARFVWWVVEWHLNGLPLWVVSGILPAMFFLIIFIGVIFEAGNETREKIWSDFGAEQKWRAERKESGFCSYRCFWESEKLMVKKFSLSERIFCSRAAF